MLTLTNGAAINSDNKNKKMMMRGHPNAASCSSASALLADPQNSRFLPLFAG